MFCSQRASFAATLATNDLDAHVYSELSPRDGRFYADFFAPFQAVLGLNGAVSRVFAMQALTSLMPQIAPSYQPDNWLGELGKLESTPLFFDKVCPY